MLYLILFGLDIHANLIILFLTTAIIGLGLVALPMAYIFNSFK